MNRAHAGTSEWDPPLERSSDETNPIRSASVTQPHRNPCPSSGASDCLGLERPIQGCRFSWHDPNASFTPLGSEYVAVPNSTPS